MVTGGREGESLGQEGEWSVALGERERQREGEREGEREGGREREREGERERAVADQDSGIA